MSASRRCRSAALPALLALLLAPASAPAVDDTAAATIEIFHLPLEEAADLARSEMTPDGRLTLLPSRRVMLVEDRPYAVRRVRAILARFDVPQPQLTLRLAAFEMRDAERIGAEADRTSLPGGWVRLRALGGERKLRVRRRFELRLTSGETARIEAGEIRLRRAWVRLWLGERGVLLAEGTTPVAVTSGLAVRARLAGDGRVTAQIRPWVRRAESGDTVELVRASTKITVPLDTEVTLATVAGEARRFGHALLSAGHTEERRDFALRLRISRAGTR